MNTTEDEKEKQTWAYMKLLFTKDAKRDHILKYLGYNREQITAEIGKVLFSVSPG